MHTQGPWQSIKTGCIGIDVVSYQNNKDLKVARTYATEVSIEDEQSNAHLIAAAPDMLFELKVILKRFELEVTENPTRSFPGRSHMDDIRRVIAKAEAK